MNSKNIPLNRLKGIEKKSINPNVRTKASKPKNPCTKRKIFNEAAKIDANKVVSETLCRSFCHLYNNKSSTKLLQINGTMELNTYTRKKRLTTMESRAQGVWKRNNFFTAQVNSKEKFFETFPYPYMNGDLHLGHAFSMTKCDFLAWYKRLQGFNVLFPFGYHCTGMPIEGAAIKLKHEIETYGNPPKFPQGKRQRQYQYEIMEQLGLPKEEIIKFVEPQHWIEHFPFRANEAIHRFGLHTDFDRSFITTSRNPYYDSFIRWQFNTLKAKGYLKFGKRPSIYSPKDKQICADHDRAEGQGVTPEEYLAVKLELLQLNQHLESLKGKKIFLVAATLRPEALYGQTSCFLLPCGDYCAVLMKNDQVFICSQRSARNMAYQHLTKEPEKLQILLRLKGSNLMGLPIKAPLAAHPIIYTLPMVSIKMDLGTGVVTCAPADAPHDWIAMKQIQTKQKLRQKYNITEKMVSIQPIQIIHVPGYGNKIAEVLCERLNILSHRDKELLDEAKDEAYKKSFHEGVLLVGPFKGRKVSQVKGQIRKQLIQSNDAFQYYEPNGYVLSRSNEECVVAFCDQWYINYADEEWKAKLLHYVETKFVCSSETLYNEMRYTIGWLKEWGCSRSTGLGTRLPFDQQYIIQSISDSNIYSAYYTISHYLQGDIFGSRPGTLGIRPDQLTHDFWDYIYYGKPYSSNKVATYKLEKMRNTFLYWFPMDLLCSGKDLVKNHLTMIMFGHVAMWEDDKYWPKMYYCNGYINVDGKKMSKSKGNFITLDQSLNMYGADASRMACALAGDSINDANFTKQNANASIIQLSALEMYLSKAANNKASFRRYPKQQVASFDLIFQNQLENQIGLVSKAYDKMLFRDALKYGLHELVSLKNQYIINCGEHLPRFDLIEKYIHYQLMFLYPICPHFCEVAYVDYFLAFTDNPDTYPEYLGTGSFPKPKVKINTEVVLTHKYVQKLKSQIRKAISKHQRADKKKELRPKKIEIYVRPTYHKYQIDMLSLLKKYSSQSEISPKWREEVKYSTKEETLRAFKFGGYIEKKYKLVGEKAFQQELPFNEATAISIFKLNITKEFDADIHVEEVTQDTEKQFNQNSINLTPGNPHIIIVQ